MLYNPNTPERHHFHETVLRHRGKVHVRARLRFHSTAVLGDPRMREEVFRGRALRGVQDEQVLQKFLKGCVILRAASRGEDIVQRPARRGGRRLLERPWAQIESIW